MDSTTEILRLGYYMGTNKKSILKGEKGEYK